MDKKKIRWQLPFLILLVIGTIYAIRTSHPAVPFQKEEGTVFGTFYHITYQCDSSLKQDIENELKKVDASLSPFNKTSVITRVNNNEDVTPDSLFTHVFTLAQTISAETGGAFDITVAPLVNAWGFGFKQGQELTQTQIDSVLQFVGIDKVTLTDGRIVKQDPRVILDCNAIAKGFGCDVVACLFDCKGIRNYMIEIGGEVVVKGCNPQQKAWKVGINKPIEDSLDISNDIQDILHLKDCGLATSGNYRNYYYKNGKRYAHTIHPKNGYPVQQDILSSTVIAKDCATADAYATAFMVTGLEEARRILYKHPEIQAYFILATPDGGQDIFMTPGVKALLHP